MSEVVHDQERTGRTSVGKQDPHVDHPRGRRCTVSYPRVSRGSMAADVLQRDFTQIHNRLFRDPRLSFKAKGIFGLISTHQDGYGVTPEWIAQSSTDGPAAVRTGLRELEACAYLTRDQERNPDGTMGPMTYSITDMPRSEPVSDHPHAAEPQAADRADKKTRAKKTSREKTNRPSVPAQRPHNGEDGGTDGEAPPEERIGSNEGVDLLLAIGANRPEFLLTGKTLRDQGLTVAGMLAEGWTTEHLWQVIAGRDLPSPIRTTVGAVVSSRLRAAISGPVPQPGAAPPARHADRTPTPASWSQEMVLLGDRAGECEGQGGLCGRPTPGESHLCLACMESEGAAL
ncbi:hypothetical protein ACWGIN_27690 [Streptomyces sp. NPDC054861]